MADFFVGSSIIMMWFVLIAWPLTLISLRVVAVIVRRFSWKKALVIILCPFSICFYLEFSGSSKLKNAYLIAVAVLTFLTLYAGAFVIYTHFA